MLASFVCTCRIATLPRACPGVCILVGSTPQGERFEDVGRKSNKFVCSHYATMDRQELLCEKYKPHQEASTICQVLLEESPCPALPRQHILYNETVFPWAGDFKAVTLLETRYGNGTGVLFFSVLYSFLKYTPMQNNHTSAAALAPFAGSNGGERRVVRPVRSSSRLVYFSLDQSLGAAHTVAQWARWKTVSVGVSFLHSMLLQVRSPTYTPPRSPPWHRPPSPLGW